MDISEILNVNQTAGKRAEHSTNTKAGYGLEMEDFLTLMVATLQNQSIDQTADTSDMLNQMVQMSVITAINNISSLVSESTALNYAASLVGKHVTVGVYVGNQLVEIYGEVTGTGTLNGQQVIFMGDDIYYLSQVMAVGKLPASDEEKAGNTTPGVGDATQPGNGDDSKVGDDDGDDDDKVGDGDDKVGDGDDKVGDGDDKVGNGEGNDDNEYDGSDGVDSDET